MATRRTPQQAAANRIIQSAIKYQPKKSFIQGAWKGRDGQYITDGFRGIRLKQALEDIPTITTCNPKNYFGLDRYLDPISREPRKSLFLPSIKDLRAAIKTQKEEAKAEGERLTHTVYDFGDGLPRVNAEYLLDMIAVLPGCVASVPTEGTVNAAIYFESVAGDGILLPIHKPTK